MKRIAPFLVAMILCLSMAQPARAASNESVKFIKGITIPDTLGNEMQGAAFNIRISAETIQSEHFEPDFGEEDPWFGTVIEACVDSDSYSNPEKTDTQSFQVIYEDGSQGLICTDDDFFSNWDRLMPGDVMTGTVEISNRSICPSRSISGPKISLTKPKTARIQITPPAATCWSS